MGNRASLLPLIYPKRNLRRFQSWTVELSFRSKDCGSDLGFGVYSYCILFRL